MAIFSPFRRWLLSLALFGSVVLAVPSAAPAAPPTRIVAPELDGGKGWIGTDVPIRLKELRGKIVIIDFWTLC